ncbi:MAG: urea transporter permease [Verrucomicrobia bacterium]|nr:urea transporter permease [Verrucomicrobiota bacterium]
MIRFFRSFLAGFLLLAAISQASAASNARNDLVAAILSEDVAQQTEMIKKLAETNEPIVVQVLSAWRLSGVYIHEADDKKIPFLLDAQLNSDGAAKGARIADGEFLKDADGKPIWFSQSDLTAADTNSKLRKTIKTTLDFFSLADPNLKVRRDATIKLGQEQNLDYIPNFEAKLAKETDKETIRALKEAISLTQLTDEKKETRIAALKQLGDSKSINSMNFLQDFLKKAKADTKTYSAEEIRQTEATIDTIEKYMAVGNFVGTSFRGLSTAAVLLIAALGLAITFGLMGVINMAHGEIMAVGAYTAYVTQNLFKEWFGATGGKFDMYFIVALVMSFLTAAAAGLILERGIIRFLYKRPLESLLATWGVSLVLQQIFRSTFGAANVQVGSPSWLSGSYVIQDVLFAYNRIFVIVFAVLIVYGTYLLLTKTSLGLQIRAVMQNRNMAACMGVRTDRVNMMTFAFGSGLAGMAGACMSQLANVGPSLGQNYIVDCFMIVVLGGVGSLGGTVSASLGVGVTNQVLEPWLGAVLGKIIVLGGIILFLQWRPAGLFATKSRSLDG